MAAHIRQDIVERADGVPLFVEEMTKAVLETQSEGHGADFGGRFPPLPRRFPQRFMHH